MRQSPRIPDISSGIWGSGVRRSGVRGSGVRGSGVRGSGVSGKFCPVYGDLSDLYTGQLLCLVYGGLGLPDVLCTGTHCIFNSRILLLLPFLRSRQNTAVKNAADQNAAIKMPPLPKCRRAKRRLYRYVTGQNTANQNSAKNIAKNVAKNVTSPVGTGGGGGSCQSAIHPQ